MGILRGTQQKSTYRCRSVDFRLFETFVHEYRIAIVFFLALDHSNEPFCFGYQFSCISHGDNTSTIRKDTYTFTYCFHQMTSNEITNSRLTLEIQTSISKALSNFLSAQLFPTEVERLSNKEENEIPTPTLEHCLIQP